MPTHRKRLWLYSFFLLFIMACRTSACATPQGVVTTDATSFMCQRYTEAFTEGTPGFSGGFTCKIECPSGEYSFDIQKLAPLGSMSYSEVQAQYCPAASTNLPATEEPTEPPTDAPTEEATEEPAPTEAATDVAPLNPYLTGAFTTCDNEARYVNFSIADPAAPFDPNTDKVLFNGVEAICTRAASAFNVLTCIYPPAPNGPPAIIEVFIGERRVNEFNFNGGEICNPVQPPNTNDNEEEEQQPAPTEAPTEAPTQDPNDNNNGNG